jgi:hypothetical protein
MYVADSRCVMPPSIASLNLSWQVHSCINEAGSAGSRYCFARQTHSSPSSPHPRLPLPPPRLQQPRNRLNPIPPPLQLRQHNPQHRHRPSPSIMTYHNPPRPHHTQHMPCIHARILDLWIMRINPPEHHFKSQPRHLRPHALSKKPGARAKKAVLRSRDAEGRVRRVYKRLDLMELRGELNFGKGARGFVVHGVIP